MLPPADPGYKFSTAIADLHTQEIMLIQIVFGYQKFGQVGHRVYLRCGPNVPPLGRIIDVQMLRCFPSRF
jgi:hypothetical protein